MKSIRLANSNKEAIVDEDIFNFLYENKISLYYSSTGYVRFSLLGIRYFLHRYVVSAGKGIIVDHKNGNGLDNRRCNLRVASSSENLANSLKNKGFHSLYKGVSYDTNGNRRKRYMARCQYKGKSITIGRFITEEEAALAYNKKAVELWGEFAVVNDVKNKTQKRNEEK